MTDVALDQIDAKILTLLQDDARATLNEISSQVHMSTSQVQRRIRRLEEAAVVLGYTARIDAAAVGLEVGAFVEVTLDAQDARAADAFHKAIRAIPEVLECHRVSGDADYLLRIVTEDLKGYSSFAQETILAIPQVGRLRSMIIFESPKDTTTLPL